MEPPFIDVEIPRAERRPEKDEGDTVFLAALVIYSIFSFAMGWTAHWAYTQFWS